MNDYSVTAYLPDDIFIERNGEHHHVWLKKALGALVAHVEENMCEANAHEVYNVAAILNKMALELVGKYKVWQGRNFEK